jgi:hypothetical protein
MSMLRATTLVLRLLLVLAALRPILDWACRPLE